MMLTVSSGFATPSRSSTARPSLNDLISSIRLMRSLRNCLHLSLTFFKVFISSLLWRFNKVYLIFRYS